MFKIKDTQNGGYFADGAEFETVDEVSRQLMDYHADDLVEPDLPLDELCARFGWEIEKV